MTISWLFSRNSRIVKFVVSTFIHNCNDVTWEKSFFEGKTFFIWNLCRKSCVQAAIKKVNGLQLKHIVFSLFLSCKTKECILSRRDSFMTYLSRNRRKKGLGTTQHNKNTTRTKNKATNNNTRNKNEHHN
jgi:hypothetical protein